MYLYGITISFGIFISALIAEKYAKKQNLNADILWGGLFVGILGGVVGARLYHVIDLWDFYQQNFILVFKVWRGGLGIYGGIFGGIIAVTYYLKRKKENVMSWLNIAALVMPLGQAIGRFGNYFNKELLPYALYESVLNFVLFLFLILVAKRGLSTKIEGAKNEKGIIFFAYLIGYSIIRIILEPFHQGGFEFYGFNVAQTVSVLVLLISAIFLIKSLRK